MAGILAKIAARAIVLGGGAPWWLFTIATKTGQDMYNEASDEVAEALSRELGAEVDAYNERERKARADADAATLYWQEQWRKKQGK